MLPQWDINELKARYQLEPSLKDTFVEGASDKYFFERAFREMNIERTVYEINTVNVPKELLILHGLSNGNRQRVMALCLALNLTHGRDVCCIIDKDTDQWLGCTPEVNGL